MLHESLNRMTQRSAPNGTQGSDIGSALCTNCGLCCMGIIHANAVLDSDEVETARDLGLQIRPTERPLFALPCPRLAGTACSIYEQRPRVCARYKCQLLQDVESGEASSARALETVAEAHRLLAEVRMLAPARDYQDIREQALRADGDEADSVHLRLRVTALDYYLDKHFRNDRDRKSLILLTPDGFNKDGQE